MCRLLTVGISSELSSNDLPKKETRIGPGGYAVKGACWRSLQSIKDRKERVNLGMFVKHGLQDIGDDCTAVEKHVLVKGKHGCREKSSIIL